MGLISWIVNALRTHNQLPARAYTLDYVFSTSLLVYMLLTSPVVTRSMLVYNVMKYTRTSRFVFLFFTAKFFLDNPYYFFSGFFIKNRGAQAFHTLNPSHKVCRGCLWAVFYVCVGANYFVRSLCITYVRLGSKEENICQIFLSVKCINVSIL